MKKITLDLDALAVESFETHAVEGTGTVVANAAAGPVVVIGGGTYPNCSEIDACPSAFNCSLNYTCAETTCGNTAELSCGASCGGFVSECNVCSGPYC